MVAIRRHDGHIDFLNVLSKFLKKPQLSNPYSALVIVKIIDIEEVNTSFDYDIGDQFYSQAFDWLTDNTREKDIVYPLTNNKFAILLSNIKNKGHVILAANKLLQFSNKRFAIQGEEIFSQISIGISLAKDKQIDAIKFLQNAEIALENAEQNHNSFDILLHETEKVEVKSFEMKSRLETALDNNEYFIMYQPKVGANNGIPVGMEALIRWENSHYGTVSPDLFIPQLEKTRLINEVTDFVLNTSLRKQKELSENYLDIPVSVNFSPIVLQHTKIEEVIVKALGIWGNKPSNLVVEITETAIMENRKKTARILNKIRDMGVAISIDDFGTGYSSLAYFKNIPADEIKIDKSFVKNLLHDKADYNVVRSIIDLAHAFGHTVVAEGVEDEKTWEALKNLGCDIIQGYFVSKPLIYNDLTNWLEDYKYYAIAIGSK